ncbi:methyltransferase [Streptomyces sp. NPDC047000]|uniref:class I SAM-dependent methyltransferase n=1 Tax=Streptomyces sp. NPDC047000 TaxID=3155474 RepID=UPI0033C65276
MSALLEIGQRLGILPYLEDDEAVEAAALAAAVNLPVAGVEMLLTTYEAAAIIEKVPDREGAFRAAPSFPTLRYQAGYLSWALNANRPFIEHARAFLEDPESARTAYRRDMEQVAVSSQWQGEMAFYPSLVSVVLEAAPTRIVDLGAGTARMLIDVLQRLPDTTGVALDLAHDACAAARVLAASGGVADRLTVVERSIQSLATDDAVLAGADMITAGFVFHDMLPEEEATADAVLRNCRAALPEGGLLAVTDAVPYAATGWERRFSALVTYMHQQFMGRKLLTESEWGDKLSDAGFSDVLCVRQSSPTGRLFIATA